MKSRWPGLHSALSLCAACFGPSAAHAQLTKTGAYVFYGGLTGSDPVGTTVFDSAGRAYGVTFAGGAAGAGTVFQLTPPASGTVWPRKTLHSFAAGKDGAAPYSGLGLDASGNLFGVTYAGGSAFLGTAFELSPPAAGHTAWRYARLTTFTGGADGSFPLGAPAPDSNGAVWGTTYGQGTAGDNGTVFVLKPRGAGKAGYIRQAIYAFQGGNDGGQPAGQLHFLDPANPAAGVYGTTYSGGAHGAGTIYHLRKSAGAWKKIVDLDLPGGTLPSNPGDGVYPVMAGGHLVLVATTYFGGGSSSCGGSSCGTLFEYDTTTKALTVLHAFAGGTADGATPFAAAPITLAGGTVIAGMCSSAGANGWGNLWHLTLPSLAAPTVIHLIVDKEFKGGRDGGAPQGSPGRQINGNDPLSLILSFVTGDIFRPARRGAASPPATPAGTFNIATLKVF